ncbi:MAG: peptide chain release factor N(5)-glutamine methyltransferase [Moraxella sp.]|nr:peptide chain release factor N(5)-glutamine methyltransferase [Moraxella sp.]
MIPPKTSIRELRQYFRQLTYAHLPKHWLDDWLLTVLNQPQTFLITDDGYILNDDELARLNTGIARMMSGEPLAYLLGKQAFWGREFMVNPSTLIPRPDTEILVEAVLNIVAHTQLPHPSILDLGTGSGCIAITLAKELPHAHVWATDTSQDALLVAKHNAATLGADNCHFVHSNWFSAMTGRFDVIVSNPPYIAPNDTHLSSLSAEPISALVAEMDGLADIITLVTGAHAHLATGGVLALEHGHTQAQAVQALLTGAGFCDVRTLKDYGNNDRVSLGYWHEPT